MLNVQLFYQSYYFNLLIKKIQMLHATCKPWYISITAVTLSQKLAN